MTLAGLRSLIASVGEEAHRLVDEQYRVLNDEVLPALAYAGIRLVRRMDLNAEQRAWVAEYFQREVKPLLTPIGLDPAHPFPAGRQQEPELRRRALGSATRSAARRASRS